MATHHITGNTSKPVQITGSDDIWIVDKTASVVTGQPFHETALFEGLNSHDNTIVINGTVTGDPAGGDWGVLINGKNTHVEIGQSGELRGEIALYAAGKGQSLVNHGDIISNATGVQALHHMEVDNDGMIKAGVGFWSDSGGADITNESGAKILAGDMAFHLTTESGDSSTIVNHGLINAYYYVINSTFGDETVINDGVMKGAIDLGAGNDTFDNRGGSIDHDVNGDEGNDTLITDQASTKLSEGAGGGTDTVKSTVSYHLNDFVENLILIGKGNTNATGNTSRNRLDGNSGINALSGDAGKDRLDGHGGDDMMTGGAEADTFVFSTGSGHDSISDFEKGVDHIDLGGWDEVKSFADLKAHHISEVGNDLVIEAGDDSLTLRLTSKADLHAADFIF